MASNDIGVKVSQLGWDVNTAGDANLYFSSSWPIIKINSTATIQGAGSVINHGLTYPPLVLVWNATDGLQPCRVNFTQATMPSMLSATSRYFVFRVPINKPYQSKVIHGPITPAGGGDTNFGLKFVKSGKSLDSDDLRDFTLHSSARSPLLHAVLYDKLKTISGQTGLSLRWTADLPYTPLYYTFYSSDGITFTPLSTLAQTPPKTIVVAGSSNITINSTNAGFGSVVLLKDPLDQINRLNKIY